MKKLWEIRELSTVAILVLEILFFTWWLWPSSVRASGLSGSASYAFATTYASLGKLDTRGVTYSMALRGSF